MLKYEVSITSLDGRSAFYVITHDVFVAYPFLKRYWVRGEFKVNLRVSNPAVKGARDQNFTDDLALGHIQRKVLEASNGLYTL